MADNSVADDNGQGKENVVPFPRAIIAEQKVRNCRRMVETLTAEIEAADADAQDGFVTKFLAQRMLEHWLADLRMAEAEVAGTALTHNGVVYAETAGRA